MIERGKVNEVREGRGGGGGVRGREREREGVKLYTLQIAHECLSLHHNWIRSISIATPRQILCKTKSGFKVG